MSTFTHVRDLARPATPSFSIGRIAALMAGTVMVGVEALVTRAELRRSRKQLAELDDRLLQDIGLDRARARFEASKGYWS
jgi:uncharacterized protein YjiS (DUF1127 family)